MCVCVCLLVFQTPGHFGVPSLQLKPAFQTYIWGLGKNAQGHWGPRILPETLKRGHVGGKTVADLTPPLPWLSWGFGGPMMFPTPIQL